MHEDDRVRRQEDPLARAENPLWYEGAELSDALLLKILLLIVAATIFISASLVAIVFYWLPGML